MAKANIKSPSAKLPATNALSALMARPEFWRGLVIALAVFVAYAPVFYNGFIWDDDAYITRNGTLRSLEGLWQIWFKLGAVPQYYPLVHTMFWVEYHLWGLNAAGYHAVNLLLHAATAILLWRALVRLALPAAWLAALLFALHPVHVESVAWATERKNVLSGVFYFAAALAALRFFELRDAPAEPKRAKKFYALAFIFFVCALWSKTVACSLPAALLLVRWWKKGRVTRRDVLPLLPFFIVGAGMGLLTAWVEKHGVGASGADWALSLADRFVLAGRVTWFYAAKLLVPLKLTFIYPHWTVSAAVAWQWVFLLGALAVLTLLWARRERWGRGPLVAALFFGGTLFPALGFVNVYPFRYSYVADHFQYLASIGLLVLAASALQRVPELLRILLVLVLAGLTWRQTLVYRDLETLWRDTLVKNPNCGIAHNNLGLLLAKRGESAAAEAEYRAALRADPDDPETLNNLGVALGQRGETAQAVELLRDALRRSPENNETLANLAKMLGLAGRSDEGLKLLEDRLRARPDEPVLCERLGHMLADAGRVAEAEPWFRKAIALKPDYADAHNDLGLTLMRLGKIPEALAQFGEALRLDPHHALAHNNLGFTLLHSGRVAEAQAHFDEALRLDPTYANARLNRARSLVASGQPEAALEEYQRLLRDAPHQAEALNEAGNLLLKAGNGMAAAEFFRQSLADNPRQPQVHLDLGNAHALAKNYEAAVGEFQASLALQPELAAAQRNLGFALLRLGRTNEALPHLHEALRLNPGNSQLKTMLEGLEIKPW